MSRIPEEPEKELGAKVEGAAVATLKDWSSLWADLLLVDMILFARAAIEDTPANLFRRRGLWEAAVIAYGRTATTGRRQEGIEGLVAALGSDALGCHDEIMEWRHRHAAHRVNLERERVEVRFMFEEKERVPVAIAIRVAPTLGPEQEESELATRFATHVKSLRDMVWTERMGPAGQNVIAEHAAGLHELLAQASIVPPGSGFAIDIRLPLAISDKTRNRD